MPKTVWVVGAALSLAQAMTLERIDIHTFQGPGWMDIGEAAGLPGSGTLVLAVGLQRPDGTDTLPALGYLDPESGDLRLDTLSGRIWELPRLAVAVDGAIHLAAAIRTGTDSTGIWLIERTRTGAPHRDTALLDSGFRLSIRDLEADAGGSLRLAIERRSMVVNTSVDRSILRIMKVHKGYRSIQSRDSSIDRGSEGVYAARLDAGGGFGLASGHLPYSGYGWGLFIHADSALGSMCYRREALKSYRGDARLTALLPPGEEGDGYFLAAGISSDIRFVSKTSLMRVGCGAAVILADFEGFGPAIGLERLGGGYVLAAAGEMLLLDSAYAVRHKVAFEGALRGLAVHDGLLLAWGRDGANRPVLSRYAVAAAASLRTTRARAPRSRVLRYSVDGRTSVKGRVRFAREPR